MHVISLEPLRLFWQKHPEAEAALRLWHTRAKHAEWNSFIELRADFPSADLVGRLTVFNVGGNKYRLVTRVEFQLERVYVRSVLTHAEYDKEKWKDDEWF